MHDLESASDAALVAAIARSSEAAMAEVYRRHADVAFGLGCRILRDPVLAEEVVQEVLLRLWLQSQRFDADRGSLRSFLLADVRGRALDLSRTESRRRGRELRSTRLEPGTAVDLEQEVWELTVAQHVRDSVDLLSVDERLAIELAYFGGYSYREVARILEVPEGTVKSRIRAGMRRLRDSLVDGGITGTSWTDG